MKYCEDNSLFPYDALLPPGTDISVLRYEAHRKGILQHYDSFSTSVGSISWDTGAQTTIYMTKPFSRGSTKIASTDILDNPIIDFGALTDPTDIEVLLALFRKNRELMAQPSMQELVLLN